MSADKKIPDVFDQFDNRELLLNYRRALEKTKQLADSANRQAKDATQDIRNIESAIVNYLNKTDEAVKKIDDFLALPWYKKLFYKGNKNGTKI